VLKNRFYTWGLSFVLRSIGKNLIGCKGHMSDCQRSELTVSFGNESIALLPVKLVEE